MNDWYDSAVYPQLRDGPPWVMQDMIESQPELLEQIATRADTAALALLLRGPGPLAVVGCGTSEHAAAGVAEVLTEAGVPALARQAFEAALEPQRGGAVIATSHEAGTWATADALAAARAAESRTGLITARPHGSCAEHADGLLVTPAVDRSWCHTVGYTSPLAAGVALAAAASGGGAPSAGVVRSLIGAGLVTRPGAAAAAGVLAGCERLIVVGSGADRTSARELVLKVEEACHLPAAMRDLETMLHGHLPAEGETTGMVLVACDRRNAARRRERAQTLLLAAARVGIRCAVIATDSGWEEFAPAGVIEVPDVPELAGAAAALLAAAVPLQLLALELALARGTNPDLIRREQAPWREAAAIAEGA